MYEDNKEKILTYIVCFLICIIVGVLCWYFGMKKGEEKVTSNSRKSEVQVQNEISENSFSVPEVLKIDKIKANEELKLFADSLKFAGYSMDDKLIMIERINKTELLDKIYKLRITFYYIIKGKSDASKIIANIDYFGNKKINNYAIEIEYFKKYYNDLFDEELKDDVDYSVISNGSLVVNGYLYASIEMDNLNNKTILKVRNISKLDKLYTLDIDCLYFTDIANNKLSENIYYQSENLEYPEELISYKIKIIYEIDDGKYYMKSMVAY